MSSMNHDPASAAHELLFEISSRLKGGLDQHEEIFDIVADVCARHPCLTAAVLKALPPTRLVHKDYS